MRKRSSLLTIAAVVTAALIILAIWLSHRGRLEPTDVDAQAMPSAQVAPVRRGAISHSLTLAGEFQPYQVVEVHAKVSGYIRHIYVDIGDRVHAGETLAVLEVPELDAQLQGTAAEYARSKDEITRAEHNVVRAESQYQALHADYIRLKQAAAAQPGLIAQQELDDAQSKDLASAAQIDAAKAALSAAENQSAYAKADNQRVHDLEAYTNVTAPLNGVIIWRYADTGALIQAGTASDVQSLPIVKLSQSDLLRLRLPVPEEDVRYIHVGDSVQVTVGALNRSFSGKVVRFTRDVSTQTRTMQTEIDVPNPNLTLMPGMYANATLQLQRHEDTLTVPIQAVMQNGNQASVLIVDAQDRVESRNVTLGIQNPARVEILSGLNAGDRVITGGLSKYQVGEKVRPIQAMSAGEGQ
ncbi:MAG TPA: efflux RND transporter periplasmic adaptor subunit [Acidobacteriaceae bacterium]|nr:efflux RND transporter periplasmic adaptor subunit [Acidobacteriaceae bacterium]